MLPEMIGGLSPFDQIARIDDAGEHWTGRGLQPVMQYARWEKFAEVIEKAKASLALVEGVESAERHFAKRGSDGGRWGNQQIEDYRLTRFGAYLTAMAGDHTKQSVAEARIYFAVKTREAEVAQRFELPTSFAEALELAAAQARALEAAAPMVEQAKQHRAADGLMSVPDFANKLKAWAKQEYGVKVLHKEVWDFLGEIGLLIRGNTIRHNHPTAEAVQRDFVRLKETVYEDSSGFKTAASPRLTPAGEGWAWDRAVKRIESTGSLRKSVSA